MKKKLKYSICLILIMIPIVFIHCSNIKSNEEAIKKVASNIETKEITKSETTRNKIKNIQEYYSNKDINGIITIENISDFSYPVAQTTDNDYYLNHDYYKNYDPYGSIYADYRVNLDNSRKLLIYGHSSIKKELPFNKLENYYDESYYKDHKYITLETKTDTYRYEIFSVYVETSDFTYMNINFDTDKEWYSHLLKLQSKSMYLINTDLTKDDEILILQTCSNNSNYQKYSKKYLLIVSRRV